MAAMGTEGEVTAKLFVTGGAAGGLRRTRSPGGAAGVLFREIFRLIMGLLEALDGLANAVSQLRQALRSEEYQDDQQNDEDWSPAVTEHRRPLGMEIF
jgi:hypothetical protein